MKKFLTQIVKYGVVLLLLNMVIGWWLINTWESKLIKINRYWAHFRWEEFNGLTPNSLDILFIGSSHIYHSINPNLVDSSLQVHSFNMSSGGQTPVTTYYTLKEIFKTQTPKKVILDAYLPNIRSSSNLRTSRLCYPFFENSSDRLSANLGSIMLEDIKYLIFPLLEYNRLVSNFLFVPERKIKVGRFERYIGKGHVGSSYSVDSKWIEEKLDKFKPYKVKEMKEMQLSFFWKAIELCKIEGIEVIVVNTPVPKEYFEKLNYEVAFQYFDRSLKEQQVPYYDFNMQLNEFYPSAYFKDTNHLNELGAINFTNDLLKSKILD